MEAPDQSGLNKPRLELSTFIELVADTKKNMKEADSKWAGELQAGITVHI